MSTNLERRHFIQSAGLLAGAAAATGLIEQPALAQNSPQTGTQPMTYQAKPLSLDPKSVKGISEKVMVSHYENNYVGAVKRLNAIGVQLAELDFAKAPNFVINGLKRDMYEHAYHMDYGAAAAKYVDVFMEAIRWDNAVTLYDRYSRES